MEDRHALSEPRIQSNNKGNKNDTQSLVPVWLVDIHRKGVASPIDTIEISEKTLPPRKKKGKVVWRLPSDHSRLPAFAVDEKRRILELFKERKKNRRKGGGKKICAIDSGSGSNNPDDLISPNNASASASADISISVSSANVIVSASSSVCSGGSAKENTDDTKEHSSSSSNRKGKENGKGKGKGNHNSSSDGMADAADPTQAQNIKSSDDPLGLELAARGKRAAKTMKRYLNLDNDSEGGDGSGAANSNSNSKRQELDRDGYEEKVGENGNGHAVDNICNGTLASQQQCHDPQSASSSSIPPPGFNASMSSLKLNEPDRTSPLPSLPLPSLPTSSPVSEPLDPLHSPQSLPPSARFIVIPEQDRPGLPDPHLTPPTKISLAIPAAKAFIDLYYRHITLGEYAQLCNYYTPHAQKSISVGGAHSVVATRRDIMLQLQSLARSVFVVRGVVSQDTYDGRGAHILVTGVVQTGGVLSQFAHTISLAPVPVALHGIGTYSFQIHNDALSLLTTGDVVAQPPQQHQQQQQQKQKSHPTHSFPQQAPKMTNGALTGKMQPPGLPGL